MMNYAEFIAAVENNIKEYLPERFEDAKVSVTTTYKNNNVEKVGITVRENDRNVSPTVYMEDFFAQYENGMEPEQCFQKIGDFISNVSLEKDPELPEDMSDYSMFKDKIVAKLINRKMNNRMLNEMPWTQVNDLAEVYMIELNQTHFGVATVRVTDQIQGMWGVSTEQLRADAIENTPRLHPAELINMEEMIGSMMGEDGSVTNLLDSPEDSVCPMYVLSNAQRNFGAECVQYPGMLDKVRDAIGDDFYIMPSSLHEVIITPKSMSPDVKDIGQTVKEVNDTQVERQDLLSYNVYEFNKGDKELKIVNEAKEKTMEMER